ncbi:MAG: hypothetical protein EXS69_02145 [Candidatus Zambryskibacteria bacterium]|nr:hypothetical protein [Candidatus Zambryskibacteria bacterium]
MMQARLDFGSASSNTILFSVGSRISAGVRAFEAMVGPDWRDRVQRIHPIASFTSCVLCQVSGGDYLDGCRMLGLDPKSKEPALLGFNVFDRESPYSDREFEALTRGWEVVIQNPSLRNIKHMRIAA